MLVRAISNSLVGWLVADAVIDVMHNFANDKSLQGASNACKLSICFHFSNRFYKIKKWNVLVIHLE